MLGRLILRWLITFVAVYAAVWLFPSGVQATGPGGVAIFSAVLALLNILVKPIVTLITLPLTILTLGLFLFVINGLMFALASWLTGGAVSAAGFGWAILAALVVSIVSFLLERLLP